ncbi:protein LSM12 [Hordeum vulgare]|nr:protein LSM12 [Hordeum vulgare]
MEVGGEEFAVGVEGVGRAERGERRNVRVLKANYIQEFSVVGKYDDPLDPAGCVLDLAAIHAREEASVSTRFVRIMHTDQILRSQQKISLDLLQLHGQVIILKYGYCPYDLDTRN